MPRHFLAFSLQTGRFDPSRFQAGRRLLSSLLAFSFQPCRFKPRCFLTGQFLALGFLAGDFDTRRFLPRRLQARRFPSFGLRLRCRHQRCLLLGCQLPFRPFLGLSLLALQPGEIQGALLRHRLGLRGSFALGS